MSTQPPLERYGVDGEADDCWPACLRRRVFCGHPNGGPIPEGQEPVAEARRSRRSSFNTTGPVNRLAYTGTLTLHFNNDDVLDALQRAYATEAEIIAALSGEGTHYTPSRACGYRRGGPFSMTTWRSSV